MFKKYLKTDRYKWYVFHYDKIWYVKTIVHIVIYSECSHDSASAT